MPTFLKLLDPDLATNLTIAHFSKAMPDIRKAIKQTYKLTDAYSSVTTAHLGYLA